MAMQAVVVRFLPADVRFLKEKVAKGEYASLSDAVRVRSMQGFRDHVLEGLLEDIARQRAVQPAPRDFVEQLDAFRRSNWEDALKETKGDKHKAAQLVVKRAEALVDKWRAKHHVPRR